MVLVDELQGVAVQAQAAAAKQGDTVRSLKASAKDGKADKVWQLHCDHYQSLLCRDYTALIYNALLRRLMWKLRFSN